MFLVKECPSCGRGLRFPIDRGKIRVRCVCEHQFIADPDDTALYENARFDLNHKTEAKRRRRFTLPERVRSIDIARLWGAAIRGLLSVKYTLQNFRLLPAARQRRIVLIVLIIILAAILLGRLLCSPGHSTDGGPIYI